MRRSALSGRARTPSDQTRTSCPRSVDARHWWPPPSERLTVGQIWLPAYRVAPPRDGAQSGPGRTRRPSTLACLFSTNGQTSALGLAVWLGYRPCRRESIPRVSSGPTPQCPIHRRCGALSTSLAGISAGPLAGFRSARLPKRGLEPLKLTEHKPVVGALIGARSPSGGSSRVVTPGLRRLTSVAHALPTSPRSASQVEDAGLSSPRMTQG